MAYSHAAWGIAAVLAGVAATSVALGAWRANWMRAVLIVWMAAAFPLGWLIAHALLLAIYYLVVTPLGLLMRVVGHDPLQRTIARDASSYWIRRGPPRDVSSYFRQF
jgi:ABC-type uncharacterized transport system permease subunit